MDLDGLLDDVNALASLGGNHGSTISGARRPTEDPRRTPKGWEPGYKVAPGGGMLVTALAQTVNAQHDRRAWHAMVEELGMTIPEGWTVRLVEAKFDPVAWTRDSPDQDKATTKPVWRYRFAVEPDSMQVHNEDVNAIIAAAMRTRRKRPAPATATRRSLNVVYADPQAGKVALLGGTEQLVGRFRDCMGMLEDHIRDLRKVGRGPTEAAWLDAGDCIENFSNVTSQKYTNDLMLTQQVRVHRRLTFHGLDFLAKTFPTVTAASCGSNHAQVREGKDPVGPPSDDWGLEILSQVQDAYSRNEDAYGHVQFAYPAPWKDTVALDLGGLTVGLAHGHQFRPGQATTWWKGQTFGNQPITDARVLVAGHYHHFEAKECGEGRIAIQSPTLDGGSDWFTRVSGEVSVPGLLVFSTTEDGWDDLRILRPDAPEYAVLKAR